MAPLKVLSLLILCALPGGSAFQLDNNPMKVIDLFKAELKIRSHIDQFRAYLESFQNLKDPVEYFISSHDAVVRTLEHHGIVKAEQLQDLKRQGLLLLEEVLASDILQVFSLMQRCIQAVDPIVNHLRELWEDHEDHQAGVLLLGLLQVRNETVWPDEEDRQQAGLSLARIQFIHQLDAYELAKGRIGSHQSEATLTPFDCSIVANDRLSRQPALFYPNYTEYAVGIEWLEAGYKLSQEMYGESHQSTQIMHQSLINIRMQHDDQYRHMNNGKGPTCFSESFFRTRIGTDLSVTGRSVRLWERTAINWKKCSFREKFHLLCGGYQATKDNGTNFKSYMDAKQDPYYRLNPFKIEEQAIGNYILYMYHDFLSDALMDYMKYDMTPETNQEFHRSYVRGGGGAPANEDRSISHSRTQVNAWFDELDLPILAPLSEKLEVATGLRVSSGGDFNPHRYIAEPFQLGVYLPGGLHDFHYDIGSNDENFVNHENKIFHIGGRVATAMFFLNDVDSARTAFVLAGTSVEATKGSVAFWWGLNPDGTQPPESMHGGCPALYGTKWLTNKWIREGYQFAHRPCSLHRDQDPNFKKNSMMF